MPIMLTTDSGVPIEFSNEFMLHPFLPVYEEYGVRDYPKGIACNNHIPPILGTGAPDTAFESVRLGEREETQPMFPPILLPPGRYIVWRGNPRHYSPMHARDLFYEFCDLSAKGPPTEDKILAFVRRYGVLKHVEDVPVHGGLQVIRVHYPAYPVNAICSYSLEARLVFYLYHAVRDGNSQKAKERLLETLRAFPAHLETIRISVFGDGLLREWWDQLPEPLRRDLHSKGTGANAGINEEIRRLIIGGKDPLLQILSCSVSGIIGDDGPFLNTLVEGLPTIPALQLAASFIGRVINQRLSGSMSPYMDLKGVLEGDKVTFESRLRCSSLLASIWMLFFLEVAGTIGTRSAICAECGAPIINPKKNQRWHEGCRQRHHNRLKRGVLRLWREGKSMDEIAAETTASRSQISRWVSRLQGQAGEASAIRRERNLQRKDRDSSGRGTVRKVTSANAVREAGQ